MQFEPSKILFGTRHPILWILKFKKILYSCTWIMYSTFNEIFRWWLINVPNSHDFGRRMFAKFTVRFLQHFILYTILFTDFWILLILLNLIFSCLHSLDFFSIERLEMFMTLACPEHEGILGKRVFLSNLTFFSRISCSESRLKVLEKSGKSVLTPVHAGQSLLQSRLQTSRAKE